MSRIIWYTSTSIHLRFFFFFMSTLDSFFVVKKNIYIYIYIIITVGPKDLGAPAHFE